MMTKDIISVLTRGLPDSSEEVGPGLLVFRLGNILHPLAYKWFTTVDVFSFRHPRTDFVSPCRPETNIPATWCHKRVTPDLQGYKQKARRAVGDGPH